MSVEPQVPVWPPRSAALLDMGAAKPVRGSTWDQVGQLQNWLNGRGSMREVRTLDKDGNVIKVERSAEGWGGAQANRPYYGGGYYYVTYGITADDYKSFFDFQGGVCACCKKPETNRQVSGRGLRPLSVDHDHATNKVRGLLCGNCNRGIGHFKDDPARLDRAAAYLRKFDEQTRALSGAKQEVSK